MLFNVFRWGRKGVTTCACSPEWPGLVTELDGQRLTGVPKPDGNATLVSFLGLKAHCTGCGAEYPHGWAVQGRD